MNERNRVDLTEFLNTYWQVVLKQIDVVDAATGDHFDKQLHGEYINTMNAFRVIMKKELLNPLEEYEF